MEFTTPIACLACANFGGSHLKEVENELRSIAIALQPLKNKNFLHIPEPITDADTEKFIKVFSEWTNSIQIFHFAGHADEDKMMLQDGGGRGEGLSELFGMQKNLAVVFLNGCKTEEQAKHFLDAGIKVVLATTASIIDDKAKVFAKIFYESLATGKNITDSFKTANAYFASKSEEYDGVNDEGIVVYRDAGFAHKSDALPWKIYVKENCKHYLDWKLTQETAIMNRLREGSKQHFKKLKNSIYKNIQIERLLLPEMKGFEGLLETKVIFDTREITSRPEDPSQEIPLEECLTELWKYNNPPHLLLKGGGGTGKTLSLLNLWDTYNKEGSVGTPIPIFVPLHEYNLRASDEERSSFLLDYVAENYLGKSFKALAESEKDFFKKPLQIDPYIPSCILFLDGINEITEEESTFRDKLKTTFDNHPGTQIVITSRHESRKDSFTENFYKVEIQPLQEEKTEEYLAKLNIPMAELKQRVNLELLKNPMMLTLLAASNELAKAFENDTVNFDFRQPVSKDGEVLWNFVEAQLAKYYRDKNASKSLFIYARFLLKYVLPSIGYEFEKHGTFTMSANELDNIMPRIMEDISSILPTVKYFRPYLKDLRSEFHLGSTNEWDIAEQTEKITTYLTDTFQLLVKNGESYSFTHQIFRDYFAAVHILNDILYTKSQNDKLTDKADRGLPKALSENFLSMPVRKLLGEICGAHRKQAKLNDKRQYIMDSVPNTVLDDLLGDMRGRHEPGSAQVVANVLYSKSESNEKILFGENLSQLDLTKFVTNGCRFSAGSRHPNTFSDFRGARLNIRYVMPQGHGEPIRDIVYHPSGKTALSASEDLLIKEYDLASKACIGEYKGHHVHANFVRYFTKDEQQMILSIANYPNGNEFEFFIWSKIDNMPKETKLLNGEVWSCNIDDSNGVKVLLGFANGLIACFEPFSTLDNLRVNKVHNSNVMGVYLLPDKKRVLSASWDASVKIWNTETNETETLYTHESNIRCSAYNAEKGLFLTSSMDNRLRLWDINNRLLIFEEPTEGFHCTSLSIHPNGEKCLTTCKEFKEVLEINFKDRQFAINMGEHDSIIYKVEYHPDGSKFLSCSEDRTLREWDALTGKNLFTVESSGTKNYDLAVSPDGKRLLSAHTDKQIKEWDLSTKQCIALYSGHKMGISSVGYNHDGTTAYSSSRDHTIRAWDLQTGENKIIGEHSINFDKVTEIPQKKWLVTGTRDGRVKIYDLEKNFPNNLVKEFDNLFAQTYIDQQGKSHRNSANIIVAHPTQPKVLIATHKQTIIELDLDTFKHEQVQYTGGHIFICFEYDAKGHIHAITQNGQVLVWTNPLSEPFKRYSPINGYTVSAGSFSSNFEKCLVALHYENNLIEIDIANQKEKIFEKSHTAHISSLCYFEDDRSVATCSYDATIRFWDVQTGLCKDTIINYPGLFLQGCDMRDISFGLSTDLENRAKEILASYGAKIKE